jgi:hypothetical protein
VKSFQCEGGGRRWRTCLVFAPPNFSQFQNFDLYNVVEVNKGHIHHRLHLNISRKVTFILLVDKPTFFSRLLNCAIFAQ